MGEKGKVAKMRHFLEKLKANFIHFRALCPFVHRKENFQEKDRYSSFGKTSSFPECSLCRGPISVKIGEVCCHLLQEVNIWKQYQTDFVPRNQCCWQHACSFKAAAKQTPFLVAVVTMRMQKPLIHHRQELVWQDLCWKPTCTHCGSISNTACTGCS